MSKKWPGGIITPIPVAPNGSTAPGIWTLSQQSYWQKQGLWPTVPGAPTIGTATAGDATATVTFSAPSSSGSAAITSYIATSTPGSITGTAAASPITVSGLSNGTAYTFVVQATNGAGTGPASAASNSSSPAAPRGVFAGGQTTSPSASQCTIDYITISSTGNATSFGTLANARKDTSGCASSTRGLIGGQDNGSGNAGIIYYITIASTGNSTNFGSLYGGTYARNIAACNSSTRGIFAGGATQLSGGSTVNTIDYVTIDTTGNSTTFGELVTALNAFSGCSSPTRGVFSGGVGNLSAIQYITIATTGNSTSFGSMTTGTIRSAAFSSATRGVFAGGEIVGVFSNVMQYVTIATTGNSTLFGNLATANSAAAGVSSSTRGVIGGGEPSGTATNAMIYVTIATTGNGASFGQLTVARRYLAGCSSANGGVQ
jgi:hypothetical protein